MAVLFVSAASKIKLVKRWHGGEGKRKKDRSYAEREKGVGLACNEIIKQKKPTQWAMTDNERKDGCHVVRHVWY